MPTSIFASSSERFQFRQDEVQIRFVKFFGLVFGDHGRHIGNRRRLKQRLERQFRLKLLDDLGNDPVAANEWPPWFYLFIGSSPSRVGKNDSFKGRKIRRDMRMGKHGTGIGSRHLALVQRYGAFLVNQKPVFSVTSAGKKSFDELVAISSGVGMTANRVGCAIWDVEIIESIWRSDAPSRLSSVFEGEAREAGAAFGQYFLDRTGRDAD